MPYKSDAQRKAVHANKTKQLEKQKKVDKIIQNEIQKYLKKNELYEPLDLVRTDGTVFPDSLQEIFDNSYSKAYFKTKISPPYTLNPNHVHKIINKSIHNEIWLRTTDNVI